MGHFPKRETLGTFAQSDPEAVAALALGGSPTFDSTPIPAREPDVVLEGKPIDIECKHTLESSDNMAAERLMCSAAIEAPVALSPYPFATDKMREFFVKSVGIDADEFKPADGSGLSRHNLVAPYALCVALNWAAKRPYGDVWMEALAAAGEGTLKNRLKDSTFIGKTGTMNAVVCLSGYVSLSNGQKLSVSLLFNNVLASSSEVRGVQDLFIRKLEQGALSNAVFANSR